MHGLIGVHDGCSWRDSDLAELSPSGWAESANHVYFAREASSCLRDSIGGIKKCSPEFLEKKDLLSHFGKKQKSIVVRLISYANCREKDKN